MLDFVYKLFCPFFLSFQQEKQKAKVKEKIDKCVKERLVDFCDLLNIPITRATARKVSKKYTMYRCLCSNFACLFGNNSFHFSGGTFCQIVGISGVPPCYN